MTDEVLDLPLKIDIQNDLLLSDLNWSLEEIVDTRLRLQVFAEEWDLEENGYDKL